MKFGHMSYLTIQVLSNILRRSILSKIKPVDNDRCMNVHVISSLFSALNFTFLYVINSQVMSCIDMLSGQVLIQYILLIFFCCYRQKVLNVADFMRFKYPYRTSQQATGQPLSLYFSRQSDVLCYLWHLRQATDGLASIKGSMETTLA